MIKFDEFMAEGKETKSTMVDYLTNAFYKLSQQQDTDPKAYMLLIGATVMANIDDPRALQSSRRLAQLALAKRTKVQP